MFRRALIISGLLSLLFAFVAMGGGSAFAANSPTVVDFAPIQKWCAVVEVHLNGEQHTITCLQTYASRSKSPDLGRVTCGLGITNIEIWNYDYAGDLCFSGYGYLGVAIYQVNEVDNESQAGIADMWMRYYHPYGVTCTIFPYHFKYFGGGYTGVEVTQLDFGASNGPQC